MTPLLVTNESASLYPAQAANHGRRLPSDTACSAAGRSMHCMQPLADGALVVLFDGT